jgi:hypothetical protein
MSNGVVVVGGPPDNGMPKVMTSIPVGYSTMDEGIQAAIDHYRANAGRGKNANFRVYKSADPDGSEYALVEVSDGGGDMVFTGLYKVIAGKYQWANP